MLFFFFLPGMGRAPGQQDPMLCLSPSHLCTYDRREPGLPASSANFATSSRQSRTHPLSFHPLFLCLWSRRDLSIPGPLF